MAGFVLLGVLLAVCVLAGVLWPLWRSSRGLAVGLGLGLLLAGGMLYRIVGTPAALAPELAQAEPQTMDEAVAQLRAALQQQPDRVEGWLLLGRALSGQQRFAEARDAFATAVKLQPDQPEVLVAAAQARMLAEPDTRGDALARQMLEHALTLDPAHQRARWFLGALQRQAGQPGDAATTWEPLLAMVDAATHASLLQQVNLAREDAGLPPLAPQAAPAAAHRLQVRVVLAEGLRARWPADTTVFVLARVPGGPPMPVAVEKHTLATLPAQVVLDDGDSPMPTQTLSALDEVEVLVRLSASGDPMRQDGDVDSVPVRVTLPATAPVEVMLGTP